MALCHSIVAGVHKALPYSALGAGRKKAVALLQDGQALFVLDASLIVPAFQEKEIRQLKAHPRLGKWIVDILKKMYGSIQAAFHPALFTGGLVN
jgi:hypothetical protein